jgi:hypothetical protein
MRELGDQGFLISWPSPSPLPQTLKPLPRFFGSLYLIKNAPSSQGITPPVPPQWRDLPNPTALLSWPTASTFPRLQYLHTTVF